ISFESDQFRSATARTVQNTQKLIEVGFEYVCEFSEVKIFKKEATKMFEKTCLKLVLFSSLILKSQSDCFLMRLLLFD
ncbi:MAG TPA: hypothetical protein VJY36_02185, partial [Candidatus Bathyarchaeia archaeon]|nr:hypothetical protein [Candidatus Bathyarchaeia archaeon]